MDEIRFLTEFRGGYPGQENMSIQAIQGDELLGYVDYSIFENRIYVEMVYVFPEYRRKGIATMLFKKLREKYPDYEIIKGLQTYEGGKFIKHLENIGVLVIPLVIGLMYLVRKKKYG